MPLDCKTHAKPWMDKVPFLQSNKIEITFARTRPDLNFVQRKKTCQFQTLVVRTWSKLSKRLMQVPVLKKAVPIRPQVVAAVALHECSRVWPRPAHHVF